MTTQATVEVEDAVVPAVKKTPVKKQVIHSPADKKRILEEAEAALIDAGLSLEDIPFLVAAEQVDASDRKHKTSSIVNVRKSPICVVMLEWHKDMSSELDKPWDRDCQGFDDLDLALDYFASQHEFAKVDVRTYGDTTHCVLLFKDTKDFSERDYVVMSDGQPELEVLIAKALKADDIDFAFSGKVRPSNEIGLKKVVKSVAAKVTGKKTTSDAAKKLAAKLAEKKVGSKVNGLSDEKRAKLDATFGKSKALRAEAAAKAEKAKAAPVPAEIKAEAAMEAQAVKPKKVITAKPTPKVDNAAAFLGKARPAKKAAAQAVAV